MRELLKKKNVQLYSTQNEEKSCIVERWNRTIKRNMWKYFTANNTRKYIDVLPAIIAKYNNTYHRSIKCTPTFVRKPSNYQHVLYLIVGKSNCGKTTLLLNLLLQSEWLDYNHLYVFGCSLHQQEYQILRKGYEDGFSKKQVANIFLHKNVLAKVTYHLWKLSMNTMGVVTKV